MADLNIIKPAQVQTMINKFCCTIGMLPTSYKASLTYEEQILAIGHYLETVVYPAINNNAEALKELQELFVALKDYVDNYFDNLDIQEEVNNKINAMVEDGTLAEIINQEIFGELNEQVQQNKEDIQTNTEEIEKNKKALIQNESYIKEIMTLPYRHSNETYGLQGGCYCGNNTIASYFSETHTIQIISLTTGLVLREYSNSRFGHGNGMCKVGNYLYLIGTGDLSDNKIFKIPFDTLNTFEEINPMGNDLIPENSLLSSICYSEEKESFFITLGLPFPTLYCYEMNEDFTELKHTYSYNNSLANTTYGGFVTNICHWKNFIVVNYNFGKTQLFNENDFSLYKTIEINKNVGNRYYSEFEWLDTYENDDLIIGAICHSGEGFSNGIYSFGKCNLYNSTRDYPPEISRGLGTAGEINLRQNNVYVDYTKSYEPLRDGSYAHPFTTIHEATNACQIDGFNETVIYIMNDSDISNENIYLSNVQDVKIYNNNQNTTLTCKSIHLHNTGIVYISRFYPTDLLYMKESNATLYVRPANQINLILETYNTSTLNIDCVNDKVYLKGVANGKVRFNNFFTQSGICGILNAAKDGYMEFCNFQSLENVMQRTRLAGSAYTPSTSITFFINRASVKELWVQVGNYYLNIPSINFYGDAKTITLKLPDNTDLTVARTVDTTTYNRATFKYVISHPTLNIYDCQITY